MPGARLELAQEFNFPTDFKSVASADSATRAWKGSPASVLQTSWGDMPFLQNGKLSRREAESNRRISVLQTDALPLCYRAVL